MSDNTINPLSGAMPGNVEESLETKKQESQQQIAATVSSPNVSQQGQRRRLSTEELYEMIRPRKTTTAGTPGSIITPAQRENNMDAGLPYSAYRDDANSPATQVFSGVKTHFTNNPADYDIGGRVPAGASIYAENPLYTGEESTFYLKRKFSPVKPYKLVAPTGDVVEVDTPNKKKAMYLAVGMTQPGEKIDWFGYNRVLPTPKEGAAHAVVRGAVNAIPGLIVGSAGLLAQAEIDIASLFTGDDAANFWARIRKEATRVTDDLMDDLTWQYGPKGIGDRDANKGAYILGNVAGSVVPAFAGGMALLPVVNALEAGESGYQIRRAMIDKGVPAWKGAAASYLGAAGVFAIGETPEIANRIMGSYAYPAKALDRLARINPAAWNKIVLERKIITAIVEGISEPGQDIFANVISGEEHDWAAYGWTFLWSMLLSGAALALDKSATAEKYVETQNKYKDFFLKHIDKFQDVAGNYTAGMITTDNIDAILSQVLNPEAGAKLVNMMKESMVANFDKITEEDKARLDEYVKKINPESSLENEFALLDERIDRMLDESSAKDTEEGGKPLTEEQRELTKLMLYGIAARQLTNLGILPSQMVLPPQVSGKIPTDVAEAAGEEVVGSTNSETGRIAINNDLPTISLPQQAQTVSANDVADTSVGVQNQAATSGAVSPQSLGFGGLSHEFWHWTEMFTGLPNVGEFVTTARDIVEQVVPGLTEGKSGAELSEAFAYGLQYAGDKAKAVWGLTGKTADYIEFMNLVANAEKIATGTVKKLQNYMKTMQAVLKNNKGLIDSILKTYSTPQVRKAIKNFIRNGDASPLTFDDIRALHAAVSSIGGQHVSDNFGQMFDSVKEMDTFMDRYAKEYDNLMAKDRGNALENYKTFKGEADMVVGADKEITPADAHNDSALARADEIITQPTKKGPLKDTIDNLKNTYKGVSKPKGDETVSDADRVEYAIWKLLDNASNTGNEEALVDVFAGWSDELKEKYKKFTGGKLDNSSVTLQKFLDKLEKEESQETQQSKSAKETQQSKPEQEDSASQTAETKQESGVPEGYRTHTTGERAGTPYDIDTLIKGGFDDQPEKVVGFFEKASKWAKEDNITKEDTLNRDVNVWYDPDGYPHTELVPTLGRGNPHYDLKVSYDKDGTPVFEEVETNASSREDHRAAYIILARQKLKEMDKQGKLTPGLKQRVKNTEMFAVAKTTMNAIHAPMEYLGTKIGKEGAATPDQEELYKSLNEFRNVINNTWGDFNHVAPIKQATASAEAALALYETLDRLSYSKDGLVRQMVRGQMPNGERWIQSAIGDFAYEKSLNYGLFNTPRELPGQKTWMVDLTTTRSLIDVIGDFYDAMIHRIENEENELEKEYLFDDAYAAQNDMSDEERRAIGVLKSNKTSGKRKAEARKVLGAAAQAQSDSIDKYFAPDYNEEYSDRFISVKTMSAAEAFLGSEEATEEEKAGAAAVARAGNVLSPYRNPKNGMLKRDIFNTPTPLEELGITMQQAEEIIRADGLEPYDFWNNGVVSDVAKQLLSKEYISSRLNNKNPNISLLTRHTMFARLLQQVPLELDTYAKRMRVLHAIDSAKAAVNQLFGDYIELEESYNNNPSSNPGAFESAHEFRNSDRFDRLFEQEKERGYTESIIANDLRIGDEVSFPYGNKFFHGVVAFKYTMPSGARGAILYEDVDLNEWKDKDVKTAKWIPKQIAASEQNLNDIGIARRPLKDDTSSRFMDLSKLFDKIAALRPSVYNMRRIAEAAQANPDDTFLVPTQTKRDGKVVSTLDIGKYDIESTETPLVARTDQALYPPKKQVNDWRTFGDNEYVSTSESVIETEEETDTSEYDEDDEANMYAELFAVGGKAPEIDPGAFALMDRANTAADLSVYETYPEAYMEAVELGTVTPAQRDYMWQMLNDRMHNKSDSLKPSFTPYATRVLGVANSLRNGMTGRVYNKLLYLGASGASLDRKGRVWFGDAYSKHFNTKMASSRAQAISEAKRQALDKQTMDVVFGGNRQKYERWLRQKSLDKFDTTVKTTNKEIQVKITRGEIITIAMAKRAVERGLIDVKNYTNPYERMRAFYGNIDELLGHLTKEDMKFVDIALNAVADARGSSRFQTIPTRKQLETGPDGKIYEHTDYILPDDFDPLSSNIFPTYWVPSVLGTDYIKNGWDARPSSTPDNSFSVLSSQEPLAAPDAFEALRSLIGNSAMKQSHLVDELQMLHDILLFSDVDLNQFKSLSKEEQKMYDELIELSSLLRQDMSKALGPTMAKWFVENVKTDLKYNPALKELTANPVLGGFQKLTRTVASSLLMLSPKQGLVNVGNYDLFFGLSNSSAAKFYTADKANAWAHLREALSLALENPEFKRRLQQSGLSEQMRRLADMNETNSLLDDVANALYESGKAGASNFVGTISTFSKIATKYGLATNVIPDFVGIALGNYAVYNDVLTKNKGNVAKTQQEIADFILDRVSSSNYETRSAATKTLQKMGLEALVLFQNDQLQKIGTICEAAIDLLNSKDPAVRKRAWKDIMAATYSTLRYVAIQAGWIAAIIRVLSGVDLSDEEKEYLYEATLREVLAQIGGTTQLGSVITPVLNGLVFGKDMGLSLAPYGSLQRLATAARKGDWMRAVAEGGALTGVAPIAPGSVRLLDAMYKIASDDNREFMVGLLMLGGRSPATSEKMLGLTRSQKTGKLQPKKSSKKKKDE